MYEHSGRITLTALLELTAGEQRWKQRIQSGGHCDDPNERR